MKFDLGIGQIPIIASCDDNYAYPLGVVFRSVAESCSAPERLAFFVLDGGISQQKKHELIDDFAGLDASLTFVDFDSEQYKDFPTVGRISLPAYFRISIPELFHSSVERVIYLDCDIIVLGDVVELYDYPLDGMGVGAVVNVANSTYRASGLKMEDYFNSGVMLIDLDYWRRENIPEQVRSFKLSNPEKICTNDQCALNGVFAGDWKHLPLSWNQQSGIYRNTRITKLLKSEIGGEFEESIWLPNIVHYYGWSKPWMKHSYHPLDSKFREVAGRCSYSGSFAFNDSRVKQSRFSRFKKLLRQRFWKLKYYFYEKVNAV